MQLVTPFEDSETIVLSHLLRWQGIDHTFSVDRERGLALANGCRVPTLILDNGDTIIGFFKVVDWLKESGRIQV